jgi:hypothetical protein
MFNGAFRNTGIVPARMHLTRMSCRLGGSPKGLFGQILSIRAVSKADLFRGRMATLEDVLDILVAQAGSRDLDTELKRDAGTSWDIIFHQVRRFGRGKKRFKTRRYHIDEEGDRLIPKVALAGC